MAISSALGSSALLPAGLGFRNVLVNGDMRIAQRGTSFSFGTGGGNLYYGADRWRTGDYTWSAGTNPTVSNDTLVVPSGFTNSYKWANGATPLTFASGGNQNIQQIIEGYSAANLYGKQCFLSFWVRSSTSGKYSIWFSNGAFTRSLLTTYTINSANTWEYKRISIDMISAVQSGVWNTTNGSGLFMMFTLGGHSDRTGNTNLNSWGNLSSYHYLTSDSVNLATIANSTFHLTGVQLEANYQPTPFEQRPIGVELALCQRYYYRVNGPSSAIHTSAGTAGVVGGPTSANRCGIVLPVVMRRAIVTGDFSYSGIAVYDQAVIPNVTSLTGINHSDGTHLTIDYTASAGGLTAGRAVVPLLYNVGSFYAINVEL